MDDPVILDGFTVLLDIDGVLTDGTILVDDEGREHKRISFDDIDAIFRLKRAGARVGFITGERGGFCDYVERRFNPDIMIAGCKDKLSAYKGLIAEGKVAADKVCFVGDSLHDVPLLRAIEHSFVPADVPPDVLASARYVLGGNRGRGAIRALARHLLGEEDAIMTTDERGGGH
ncbi:MAG TPA: HAD hydrolase family protein [Gemmatimonadaceae bacterium]|nr:HAD hydrolase family protein [Gemmatimonadaceae bacterium]